MLSPRSLRILAMALTSAFLIGGFAVVPQGARADANAPRWSSGDYWVYVDVNNRNHTLRIDAVGQENVQTIRGTTYEAFHFKETDSTGSAALITDSWVRPSDLGLVKTSATIFNVVTVFTFDPPQSQAYFPLSRLKSWTVVMTVSTHFGGFWGNATATLSFQVDNEIDVTVPAGTFHSFSVRTIGGGAYAAFSLAYIERVLQRLRAAGSPAPTIVFTKGGGQWLEHIADCGCSAIGLDWLTDLAGARARVGARVALQGNLDPQVLLSTPAAIEAEARAVLEAAGPEPGFIFNLGHGIVPETPPEHVATLVHCVHALSDVRSGRKQTSVEGKSPRTRVERFVIALSLS